MAEGDRSPRLSARLSAAMRSSTSSSPRHSSQFTPPLPPPPVVEPRMSISSDPRLSQLFDPLSRFSEAYMDLPSTSSPRLLRRSRVYSEARPMSVSSQASSLPSVLSDLAGDLMEVEMLECLEPPVHWSGDDGVNWQERCLELELSLQKFRDQAGRVREILREKLAELEQRVVEAEARAEEAEDKVRIMEQRLAGAEWTSSEASDHVPPINTNVQEKTKVIVRLETQVEEQRQLRLQDAKQVEAKAAKIKEWVTNKLRELEEQNQHLREQNQKCNEQLELLRNHLAQLSQLGASRQKDRASTEDSSRGSLDAERLCSDESLAPDLPARPVSSTLGLLSRRRSDSGGSHPQSDSETEPLYAEVDPAKKRVRAARCPLERRRLRDSASLDTPPLSLSPKSPLEVLDAVLPPAAVLSRSLSAVDSPKKKPVPPPRTRGARKLNEEVRAPSLEPLIQPETDHGVVRNEYRALTEDLQAAVESLALIPNSTPSPAPNHPRAADEVHDYAEIYTPSKERTPWYLQPGARDSAGSSSGASLSDTKPPTPPLHRFPSWESRIYQVAADGLHLADQVVNGAQSDSTNNNRPQPNASAGYYDISVPVYATVKGRASQIRSMPFTGDSSDSSDGEDHAETRGTSSGDTDTSLSGSGSSPSKSMKTTSSLSPAKHSSSSPSKSLKRDTSFESGMSDDYAIPPDALSCETTSIDSSMPSLIRTSYIESPKKESLEKTGYLTKLGGKLKTWRKRWFVLKNGILTYWKSQNDVNRKPQGQIVLDEVCRVTRAEGAATFEISTGKKTYYLTADSIANMEDWIRVLQNVQRRNATKLLLSKEDNKPSIQGWLTKVKNGHAKKCWCVLIGKMFLYFKTPNDSNPLGQINMRDARVEEVDHVSDSDSEDREGDGQHSELTIGIFPSHQGPTYLLMPSKQEKDSWMYHLTVVSGGGHNAGTQYEQLVQKLMEMDGDPNCVLWRHPHLLHSKESIASPLTTLSSEALQAEAIKLFKSCQLFISVHLDSAGIDYHVVLAQNALQQCLDVPELQAELISALIKQTSRHTHHKIGVQVNRTLNKFKHSRQLLLCATQSLFMCDSSNAQKGSPTSQTPTLPPLDCKTNPPSFVFIQGWQLLALAVSLFVPKNNRLLWYLKLHLQRNIDSKSEAGKYAAYCQRALERTLQNGGREAKPSRMEVLSILLKNPYHHSLPHAIPVHLLNGTYQVVSFDGSTTIEEFLSTLNQEIGCREVSQSGFTLFSDDPIEKDLEHYIDLKAKLCDVISKWETALREKGSGKFENTRVIQLTYKNRLYWRNSAKMETDKERLLLSYQVNQQVIQGQFPLTKELALELASLMAQIDFGEYNSDKGRGSGGTSGNPHHQVQQALEKFYPLRYRESVTQEIVKELQESLMTKWASLKGRSLLDCVRIYLTCTRKWPFFGATLFQAKLKNGDPMMVWLSVSEDSVTILELASMQTVVRYPYTSVVTFGGCQDDFMLVISAEGGSQKLLFSLSKPKILELTLLIADYMNAMGHALPGTPQTGTLTRHGSHRSARARPGGTGSGATPRLGAEPDILKSTPDHQVEVRLQRTDSKKRTHLDSGVA